MQWYRASVNLKSNPKRIRLQKILKLKSVETIGYIHLLYSFAAQYTETGDLKKYTAEEIEGFCEWRGVGLRLFNAFLAAGFLDKKNNGEFKVHGFYEANTAHLKDLSRKRKERNVQGQSSDGPKTVLATYVRTNLTDETYARMKEGFEVFWGLYPARQGHKNRKEEALLEWIKINPDEILNKKIIESVKAIKNEQYPVDAYKWLLTKRWLDEKIVVDDSQLQPHLRRRAV